jgi:hypothetical protein
MEQPGEGSDEYGFEMSSNFMAQPPQIFGAYNPDRSPVQPVLSGSIFGDSNEQGSVDENDPKRRRIARVSWKEFINHSEVSDSVCRRATCVERRRCDKPYYLYSAAADLWEHRSSVTEGYLRARTA